MYSVSNIGCDKGLGFDFSSISDLVKSAGSIGLNIYNNQMQLKQVKSMAQSGMPYALPSAGNYVGLPMNQALPGTPGGMYPQPGMSTTEMIAIVAAVGIGGLLLMKALK